ncbi:MAG: hypothetical protein QW228_08585 [Candidatus Aenigmatarchaeota archaeon]
MLKNDPVIIAKRWAQIRQVSEANYTDYAECQYVADLLSPQYLQYTFLISKILRRVRKFKYAVISLNIPQIVQLFLELYNMLVALKVEPENARYSLQLLAGLGFWESGIWDLCVWCDKGIWDVTCWQICLWWTE